MDRSEPVAIDFRRDHTWAVHRQDDNGNRYVVHSQVSYDEAERLVADFEAKGHKQVYWIEPERE